MIVAWSNYSQTEVKYTCNHRCNKHATFLSQISWACDVLFTLKIGLTKSPAKVICPTGINAGLVGSGCGLTGFRLGI